MQNIIITGGVPGCGKTAACTTSIITTPGRYIFATTQRKLIKERSEDFRRLQSTHGAPRFMFLPIHGDDDRDDSRQGVLEAIAKLPDDYAEDHIFMKLKFGDTTLPDQEMLRRIDRWNGVNVGSHDKARS
jgi:hypothetical protein